jgi:hypothetical protein
MKMDDRRVSVPEILHPSIWVIYHSSIVTFDSLQLGVFVGLLDLLTSLIFSEMDPLAAREIERPSEECAT